MAKFVKEIARPGRYTASNHLGRTIKTITPQDIKHYEKSFNAMKKAGLKIPIPKQHYLTREDETGKKQVFAPGPKDFDGPSDQNMGYWESMQIDKATGALMAVADVPLEADAEKFGKTITETSPFITDYLDGTGKLWPNVIKHIACVMHPVIPGQKNFEPIPSEADLSKVGTGFSISTNSFLFSSGAGGVEDETHPDDVGNGNPKEENKNQNPDTNGDGVVSPDEKLKQALDTLREAIGLDLPDDTTLENLADRLIVAATAIQGRQDRTGTVTEPPTNSEPEKAISMSTAPAKTLAPEIQTAINTALEQQSAAFSIQTKGLSTYAATQRKADYDRRINALISSGRITKDAADKTIRPHLASYAFSLSPEGVPAVQPIDGILEVLEALPATQKPTPFGSAFSTATAPAGSEPVEHPAAGDDLDEKKLDEVQKEFERNTKGFVRN